MRLERAISGRIVLVLAQLCLLSGCSGKVSEAGEPEATSEGGTGGQGAGAAEEIVCPDIYIEPEHRVFFSEAPPHGAYGVVAETGEEDWQYTCSDNAGTFECVAREDFSQITEIEIWITVGGEKLYSLGSLEREMAACVGYVFPSLLGELPPITEFEPVEEDALERKVQEAEALISLYCEQADDCQSIPYGSKACGGPRGHWVYSALSSETEAVESVALGLTELERIHDAQLGIDSDCAVETPPETACVNASCQVIQ